MQRGEGASELGRGQEEASWSEDFGGGRTSDAMLGSRGLV